ncbi:hypothetical protein M0802_002445 [Mischocyttarus mexicanus]|nr:hypothetical protein M0802_002445 [Mischocyttarus mexicanus]
MGTLWERERERPSPFREAVGLTIDCVGGERDIPTLGPFSNNTGVARVGKGRESNAPSGGIVGATKRRWLERR